MSTASKQNRHGKGGGEKGSTSEKAPGKEWKASKVSSKNSSLGSPGMSASAYNPGTRMLHMVDLSIFETQVANHSGSKGMRSVDGDTEDMVSVVGSYSEYDSVSNNGSCSGESEDQLQNINGKDKKGLPPGLIGGITGGGGGSDSKRDKIRYKNEKKHQRQKERRAQDLRDRCTGILMSRKLEALALQLVAMGFSPDKATMALIFNEGHIEQSVAWLLEGGEGQVKEDWNAEGPLKIDISEELARIADLELKFKYLRVEIDRAIVACEGDIDKACEWLQERYPRSSSGPLISNSTTATAAPTTPSEYLHHHHRHAIIPPEEEGGGGQRFVAPSYLMTATGRGNSSTTTNSGHALYQASKQRPPLALARDGKEPPISYAIPQSASSQGYQSILSRHPHPHPHLGVTAAGAAAGRSQGGVTDWHRFPPLSNNVVEGKVMINSSGSSSTKHPTQPLPFSYPTTTTTTTMPQGRHQAQVALDSRGVVIPHDNHGGGAAALASRREQQGPTSHHYPAAMMTPQSPIIRPLPVRSASVSPSLSPSSWHGSTGPSGADGGSSSPSSVLFFNGGGAGGDMLYKEGLGNLNKQQQQAEELLKVQPLQLNRPSNVPTRVGVGPVPSAWSIGSGTTSFGVSRENPVANMSATVTAAVAPSTSHVQSQSTPKFLSGWGSGLPGRPADWNMWVSNGCDYRSIDWSMRASPSSSGSSSADATDGIWGPAISGSMLGFTESEMSRLSIASDGISGHPQQSGGYSGGVNREHPEASSNSDRGNSHLAGQGIQENLLLDAGNSSGIEGAVAPEWTSPFVGKDLFTLPHQAVPSLLL